MVGSGLLERLPQVDQGAVMLSNFPLLLLVATSLGRTEGAIVADYEDLELSTLEERCKSILQQAAKAHCSNISWEGQGEELEQLRTDLTRTRRILKEGKESREHIGVEMVLAGLNAFENVKNIKPLISEYATTDTWQVMLEIFMYSLRLDYLTTLVVRDPEEASMRDAPVKHVVQQALNLLVSPIDVPEQVNELISSYLAQMQEMVTQFDPTLNLCSLGSLLAQGASKSTTQPATNVSGKDEPKVLRMNRVEFTGLDKDKKIELTKDLSAEEWNILIGSFRDDDEDYEENVSITYYTLNYTDERWLGML